MRKLILTWFILVPGIAGADEPAAASATTNYEGPMGLKWGETCPEIKKSLSKRMTFVREFAGDDGTVTVQKYKGTFAEHQSANVEVVCNPATKQLFLVNVTLPAKDVRPALIRWQEMVAQTIDKHGQPTSCTRDLLSKSEKGMSALLVKTLEQDIQNGTTTPMAEWQFKNSKIGITMLVGEPDRSGQRSLQPMWMFFGPGAPSAWLQRINRSGHPDL